MQATFIYHCPLMNYPIKLFQEYSKLTLTVGYSAVAICPHPKKKKKGEYKMGEKSSTFLKFGFYL